jgi:hypothetical protein
MMVYTGTPLRYIAMAADKRRGERKALLTLFAGVVVLVSLELLK